MSLKCRVLEHSLSSHHNRYEIIIFPKFSGMKYLVSGEILFDVDSVNLQVHKVVQFFVIKECFCQIIKIF